MPELLRYKHLHKVTALLSACLALSGCTSVRYYAHVAHGQSQLLFDRRSIGKVVADPTTDPKLASRLHEALEAREFASTQLDLPRNRSYTYYVALKRPEVVWNVFATPPFSLVPVTHCFPIAGCVAYRGYFKRELADQEAARLAARGNDIFVGGVSAYSTLGWFSDPILSTMLRWDDDELFGTIFHELAHQKLYVKDDTAFNESFANFVQGEGLRQWRQSRGLPPPDTEDDRMEKAFITLVLDLRSRLAKLYASGVAVDAMRTGKAHEIDAFRVRFQELRETQWHGDKRYDNWVSGTINNAALLPFGLYEQWVPAFAALYRESGNQWPTFYAQVQALAKLDKPSRETKLKVLMSQASP